MCLEQFEVLSDCRQNFIVLGLLIIILGHMEGVRLVVFDNL